MAAHEREICVSVDIDAFKEKGWVFADARFFSKFAEGALSFGLKVHFTSFWKADVAFLTPDDHEKPKFVMRIKMMIDNSTSFLALHKHYLMLKAFKLCKCGFLS